jgi:hypothetical protein
MDGRPDGHDTSPHAPYGVPPFDGSQGARGRGDGVGDLSTRRMGSTPRVRVNAGSAAPVRAARGGALVPFTDKVTCLLWVADVSTIAMAMMEMCHDVG